MDQEKTSANRGNVHDQFVKAVFAHVELVADFLRLYADPVLMKQLDLRKIKQESTLSPRFSKR